MTSFTKVSKEEFDSQVMVGMLDDTLIKVCGNRAYFLAYMSDRPVLRGFAPSESRSRDLSHPTSEIRAELAKKFEGKTFYDSNFGIVKFIPPSNVITYYSKMETAYLILVRPIFWSEE